MIEGVVKVYCDGEVVARVKCGSGGRMAIFGSWNGRRSRLRSVAEWAAEPEVEASKNRGEILRAYAAMRALASTGCGGALGRFS